MNKHWDVFKDLSDLYDKNNKVLMDDYTKLTMPLAVITSKRGSTLFDTNILDDGDISLNEIKQLDYVKDSELICVLALSEDDAPVSVLWNQSTGFN